MFKAVLFDVDGTLLDTSDLIYGAFNFALVAHGKSPVERSEIDKRAGTALPKFYKILAPDKDTLKLIESHRQFQSNNLHLSVIFPGIKEVLEELKNQNIKLGAITNRGKNILPGLKKAEIFDLFDIILTAEDVKNPKPDKEPVLKALKFLEVKKENVLYVGDTLVDLETARNAQVKFASVGTGVQLEKILLQKPDFVLENFNDLLKIMKND